MKMPRGVAVLMLTLLAGVMGPAVSRAADAAPAATTPSAKFGKLAVGDVAPDFAAAGADGKEIKVSDFRGRALVLAFWAPNRGPAEALQAAFAQYQPLGASVLAVGSAATRAEFDTWVAKTKDTVTYPLVWDPAGRTGERLSQKHLGLAAYPVTVVLDRKGKLVGGFIGFGPASGGVLRDLLRTAGLDLPPEETPPPRPLPPPEREDRALKPGAAAPDFTALDAAGAPVKLSDYAGKIVVLDFWATWCGPCLASMPHTQQVAAAAKTQGVVVLASCTSDSRANFLAWLPANAAKYPDLVFACDPHDRAGPPEQYAERASAKLYGVSGIPTQFVIGRDGKVAAVIVGYGGGDRRLEDELAKLGVKP